MKFFYFVILNILFQIKKECSNQNTRSQDNCKKHFYTFITHISQLGSDQNSTYMIMCKFMRRTSFSKIKKAVIQENYEKQIFIDKLHFFTKVKLGFKENRS